MTGIVIDIDAICNDTCFGGDIQTERKDDIFNRNVTINIVIDRQYRNEMTLMKMEEMTINSIQVNRFRIARQSKNYKQSDYCASILIIKRQESIALNDEEGHKTWEIQSRSYQSSFKSTLFSGILHGLSFLVAHCWSIQSIPNKKKLETRYKGKG